MNKSSQYLYQWRSGAIALTLLAATLTGCGSANSSDAASKAPATVSNAVKEAELAFIVLTDEAVKRLGLETADVEERTVSSTISYGGEVMAVPGRSMSVTAPVSGLIAPPPGRALPDAGAQLPAGATVLRLVPLPANNELLAAGEQLSLRRAQLQRVEELLSVGGASTEEVEQARVELARAQGAANVSQGNTGGANSLALTAPAQAVLQSLHVAAGQTVAAGTPLFELAAIDTLWVRVPVYAGDTTEIDRTAASSVASLSDWQGSAGHVARPVSGPVTANAALASSDLYYALDAKAASAFRPGERVRVSVQKRSTTASLVVPESALFRDIHGNAWVYVAEAGNSFHRQRVTVRRTSDGIATLARGPAPGTRVVSVAVAELAGTEFGVDH